MKKLLFTLVLLAGLFVYVFAQAQQQGGGSSSGGGGGGTGDVVGPSSVTAATIAVYNGTTGKLLAALGLSGVIKVVSGVPSVVTGTSTNCVHVDGTSAACPAATANNSSTYGHLAPWGYNFSSVVGINPSYVQGGLWSTYYEFMVEAPKSANKILYNQDTADSGRYIAWEIRSSNATTVVAHCAPVDMVGTGAKACTFVEGVVALPSGTYYLGLLMETSAPGLITGIGSTSATPAYEIFSNQTHKTIFWPSNAPSGTGASLAFPVTLGTPLNVYSGAAYFPAILIIHE